MKKVIYSLLGILAFTATFTFTSCEDEEDAFALVSLKALHGEPAIQHFDHRALPTACRMAESASSGSPAKW